jgi:hypothetical protein
MSPLAARSAHRHHRQLAIHDNLRYRASDTLPIGQALRQRKPLSELQPKFMQTCDERGADVQALLELARWEVRRSLALSLDP